MTISSLMTLLFPHLFKLTNSQFVFAQFLKIYEAQKDSNFE